METTPQAAGPTPSTAPVERGMAVGGGPDEHLPPIRGSDATGRGTTRQGVLVAVALTSLAILVLVAWPDDRSAHPRATARGELDGRWADLVAAPTQPVTRRWSRPVDGFLTAAVVGDRAVVVQHARHDDRPRVPVVRVEALDLATGRQVWRRELPVTAAVVIVDGPGTAVHLPFRDGDRVARLVALDLADGHARWTNDRATGPPTILDDGSLLPTSRLGCRSLDPTTGAVRRDYADATSPPPWPAGACRALGTDRVAVGTGSGWQVRSLAGDTLFTTTGPRPPVAAGKVVVAVEADSVRAWGADGLPAWSIAVRGTTTIRPLVDVGVVVTDDDGRHVRDLDGVPVDLPTTVVGTPWQVDVDGSAMVVDVRGGTGPPTRPAVVHLRAATPAGTEVARREGATVPWHPFLPPPWTTEGALVATEDADGPRLGLYSWRDLAPRWEVPLGAGRLDGVAAGSAGVLAVVTTDDGTVLRAFG